MTRARLPSAFGLCSLVFLAGVAALCWEVLWQLEASLAIGVSAKGTSIVLAATMGGMCLGSILMGNILRARTVEHPLRVYGSLELLVGVTGAFLLLPGFRTLERVDGALYIGHPGLATFAHVAGIVCILGPATLAMGATIPVLGLLARATGTSIATLYAVNTAGASMGVLLVSFVAIPYLGVELAVITTACVNLLVAALCWLWRMHTKPSLDAAEHAEALVGTRERYAALVVLVTGLASLGLEVAWFRALRAAFLSTTQAFAIMLVAVLLPLAAGARLAKSIADKRVPLGAILAGAGAAVLLATPVVERFDRLSAASPLGFWATNALWLGASLAVLGPSMVLLGVCLPWILREHAEPHAWGRLYAINTVGAVAGALLAAWVLLPAIGFARTAWLLGAAPLVVGVAMLRGRGRWVAAAVFASTFAVAFFGESGIGRDRVQGNFNTPVTRVLAFDEGPNSTIAVAETRRDGPMLVIDGFVATGQSIGTHYMAWMGRLPMVLHPNPQSALVICFGTGQTANAVRSEGAASLDVVELDPAVLRMAPLFAANQRVLDDPRVHPVVMDGRAWLRRTDHRYDVITLEPMPPNFAGVNSLYSREFYELAAARLNPQGVVTQWVPFHLLSVHDALSIAATFQDVFHDALLWIDPNGGTGILVGRKGSGAAPIGETWPGFARSGVSRDMTPSDVRSRVALAPSDLARYARAGEIITDDNQLLAYGPERHRGYVLTENLGNTNMAVLLRLAEGH
jgi:spermidine synthase